MGIFGGKKKPEKKGPKPISYGPKLVSSREFRLFKQRETKPLTWYERLARFAEKFVKMTPDKKKSGAYEEAINFTGLRINPGAPVSMLVMSTIAFVIFGVVALLTSLLPFLGGIVLAVLGIPIGYYLYKYPLLLVKEMRIKASSQQVLAILYMVVSMRISPNLEHALRFAAVNTTGVLAWDLRGLLWDIEMRKYYSAHDAMDSYIEKWKSENEEFSESLRLIRESERQVPQKAQYILDQALDVILDGTKTRMKHYAQDLRLPVMVIHMMGIVLPILGSIMAPMVAIFMSDLVSPVHFFIGYDIILPIILIWFINNTLRKRPVTFSQVDIDKRPGLPEPGKFKYKGKTIPVLPLAILIFAAITIYPFFYFYQNPGYLFNTADRTFSIFSLTMSALFIIGFSVAVAVYYILTNYQRSRLQTAIQAMEREFELALFQFGNRVSGGTPIEVAIDESIMDMKDLKIANLFRRMLNNMRRLGFTFEQAIFDKKYGALRYYPSKLIKNVLYTVVDTSKKGVSYAAESMLRIAKYLKNIRETQEYIRDLLEETVSSMKFQAYFLTPVITGLIVSISDVITQVLSKLGIYLENIGLNDQMGFGGLAEIFGSTEASTSPEVFQLIVGIYLIEIIFILGLFLTKIGRGDDKIERKFLTGKMLIIGVFIYFMVLMISSMAFSDIIRQALSNLGVV